MSDLFREQLTGRIAAVKEWRDWLIIQHQRFESNPPGSPSDVLRFVEDELPPPGPVFSAFLNTDYFPKAEIFELLSEYEERIRKIPLPNLVADLLEKIAFKLTPGIQTAENDLSTQTSTPEYADSKVAHLPQSIRDAQQRDTEIASRGKAQECERERRQHVIAAWDLYKSRPYPYGEDPQADDDWLQDWAERLIKLGKSIKEAGFDENLKLAHKHLPEVTADLLMQSARGNYENLLYLLREIPHSTINWWTPFNCDCPIWLLESESGEMDVTPPPYESTPADAGKAGECEAKHSVDFASVNWFGEQYTFTVLQAACVKVMWEAWENKTPILGEAAIQETAETDTPLRSIFRENSAWGTLIISPSKGRFQLKSPT